MKIAVSSYSFSAAVNNGQLKADDIIDKAKEMGFEGVEFAGFMDTNGLSAIDYAKKMADKADALSIEITGYSVGGNFLCADPEAEAERLMKEVDVAHALNTKFMRHDICYGPMPGNYKSFENNLEAMIDGARAVTEYAETLGIKTMTENHGFYAQDSQRIEMLVDGVKSDNYGVLIDIGNFLCVDEDPAKAVGVLKNYAFSVHCKDFYFHDGQTPPKGNGWLFTRGGNYIKGAVIGDGVVPIVKCLNILKSAGYDGNIAIEYEGLEDCISSIIAGKRYLDSILR